MAKITSLAELTDVASDDLLVVVDKSDTSMADSGTDKKVKKSSLLKGLTVGNLADGVLDTDLSSVSGNDDTIPSAKATKAYVDTQRASIAVPYAIKHWANQNANYSTSSTSMDYIDSTNAKATLTLKYGKLVMVDLFITGLFNANIGYGFNFDIGLGGKTTKSTSGSLEFTPAQFGNNLTTDGNSRVGVYAKFYFVDCGTGSKDFYALWNTSNASYPVYISQYARSFMYVTELFM